MRYKGLQSYTEADSANFKGRSSETKELLDMLHTNDVVVCYAASGEGKSSLINAGLCPLLRKELVLPIHITFNETDFLNEKTDFDSLILGRIADTVDKMNETITDQDSQIGFVSDEILIERLGPNLYKELDNIAWWKLRMGHICNNYQTFMPLLIFDQFEEIFSNSKSDVWINGFFQWYSSFCSTSLPEQINDAIWNIHGDTFDYLLLVPQNKVKTLFSLRNDYIGDLDYWCNQRYKITALKDTRYLLKPLMKGGAEEILDLSDFNKEIKNKIISYVCRDESQPCISALILSVLCTVLSADSRTDISSMSDLSVLIEDFYKDKISVLDTADVHELECSLVGEKNNRLRIPFNADRFKNLRIRDGKFVDLNDRTINLDVFKILRLNNSYYIELVHDCLCPIVSKKKMQYIEELADKKDQAERQKKNVLTSVWLAGHLLFFVYSLFCFYGPVVSARIGWKFSDMGDMCFGLLLYIPAIVALYTSSSFLKNNINKWDVWLYAFSEIVLLINLFYLLDDETHYISEKLGNEAFYYLVALLVFISVLLFYVIFKVRNYSNNNIEKSFFKSSLFNYSICWRFYIFCLCTFFSIFFINYGVNGTSWLVLILPFLFYIIPYRLYKSKCKRWLLFLWLLLIISDAPISYFFPFDIISHYSLITNYRFICILCLCLILTLVSVFRLYYEKKKKIILSFLNLLVIITCYCYCLGFIPFLNGFNPTDVFLHRFRSKDFNAFVYVNKKNSLYGYCTNRGDTVFMPLFEKRAVSKEKFALVSKINEKSKIFMDDTYRMQGVYIHDSCCFITDSVLFLAAKARENSILLKNRFRKSDIKSINNIEKEHEYFFSKGYNEIMNSLFSNILIGKDVSSKNIPSVAKLYAVTQLLLDSINAQMKLPDSLRMINDDILITDYYKYNTQMVFISMILDEFNKKQTSELLPIYIGIYQLELVNEIRQLSVLNLNYDITFNINDSISVEKYCFTNNKVRSLLRNNASLKSYYQDLWFSLTTLIYDYRIRKIIENACKNQKIKNNLLDSLLNPENVKAYNSSILLDSMQLLNNKELYNDCLNQYLLRYIDKNIKTSIDVVESMGHWYNSQLRFIPYQLLVAKRSYVSNDEELVALLSRLEKIDFNLNDNIYKKYNSTLDFVDKSTIYFDSLVKKVSDVNEEHMKIQKELKDFHDVYGELIIDLFKRKQSEKKYNGNKY